jgi:hypothetical protein
MPLTIEKRLATCDQCGHEFERPNRQPRRFCSETCGAKWWKDRRERGINLLEKLERGEIRIVETKKTGGGRCQP